MSLAHEFLCKHRMEPERIVPAEQAGKMAEDMLRGLKGQPSSLPMIRSKRRFTVLSTSSLLRKFLCRSILLQVSDSGV